jgi:MYXO-CTERM domain-containing protein
VAIRGGVTFDISNRYTTLAPGQCLVIAKNLAAFGTRYTTGSYPLVAGYDSQLANAGETLAVDDSLYGEVQSFIYDDQWYPTTDGGGYSLTIVDPFGTLDQWNVAQGWRASSQVFGTPGYAIPEPAAMLALALCGLWSYRRRMR